jgi:hypothetical protein
MAPQTRSECYTQRLAAADTGNYIIVVAPRIRTLRVVFRGYPLRTGSNKRWMSQLSDGTLLSLDPLPKQMPILSEPGVWTQIRTSSENQTMDDKHLIAHDRVKSKLDCRAAARNN